VRQIMREKMKRAHRSGNLDLLVERFGKSSCLTRARQGNSAIVVGTLHPVLAGVVRFWPFN